MEETVQLPPDRNMLLLCFTPAYNAIPQRVLKRLKEQGLHFRGFPRHTVNKISRKAQLRANLAVGTAEGGVCLGKMDRSEG